MALDSKTAGRSREDGGRAAMNLEGAIALKEAENGSLDGVRSQVPGFIHFPFQRTGRVRVG
jgi:hypothetical protein